MKKRLRRAYVTAKRLASMYRSVRSIPLMADYYSDFKILRNQQKSAQKLFDFGMPFPCLTKKHNQSGAAKGHYFHQDLLVARRIFLNNPSVHVDIGSRIDGFVAHVASFRSITVLDIRPMSQHIPNVEFMQADFMEPLKDHQTDFCDSLSCLHALEHFGLGRYGDPLNYDGYLVGLENAYGILKKGGKFYFSVPIGPQRIEFNAHRVFSVDYLMECFADKYKVDLFSFVDDKGDLHENAAMDEANVHNNFGCTFGCGIFEMTKL